MQVRDHALGMKDDVPKSDVNKEYYTQIVEKEVSVLLRNETQLNLDECPENMKKPFKYLKIQQLHHITTDMDHMSCGAQRLLTKENFTQPFGLPNLKLWSPSYSSRKGRNNHRI